MEGDQGLQLFELHPLYNGDDITADPTLLHNFLLPDDETRTYTDVGGTTSQNGTLHKNTSAEFVDKRDENVAKIEIAIQAVIFVLALFGNGFVLLALRYHKRKTSRLHLFITHLCIADICVAFFNILPQLAWDVTFRFQGNDIGCRLIKYLQLLVIYVSTYILVVTAIDRYRAICHPLANPAWTNKKSHIMVAIAWLIAALMSSPQLGIFRMQEVWPGSGVKDCWGSFHPEWTIQVYVTSFAVTIFFLPSLILILLYGRICYVVWRNVYSRRSSKEEEQIESSYGTTYHPFRVSENGCVRYRFIGRGQMMARNMTYGTGHAISGRSHYMNGISRAKMKTIKLTIVVIVAYIACWTPFISTQLWWAYDENAPYDNSTFVICLLLVSLNSCCNPWIYMAFSDSLVRQVIPCCRKKQRPKPPIQKYGDHNMKYSPEPYQQSRHDNYVNAKEDVILPDTIKHEAMQRKSTLSTRTTSTKTTTLFRTDSRNTPQKNVIMRYSSQHGVIAAANLANWPCATVYSARNNACNSHAPPEKIATKVCECKKCLTAMEDKTKRNRLASWKEKNEEKSSGKGSSSNNSSKSKSSSKDKSGNIKMLKVNSDNSYPFLSCNSYASEIPKDLCLEDIADRCSSV